MTQGQDTGRLLAGRYRLVGVVGKGGMGTVWHATDEMLGRTVAVKEVRIHAGIDEDEKRRLYTRTLREAKATALIRHAGAVTIFDVVEEDERPWIVMELVEARSLSDILRTDGLLSSQRAAEVGLELLGVLRSAHQRGILHRDVKPSNVLITGADRVVLTDFGIATVEGDPSVTSTGMLVGAPSYIAPERARGKKAGPASDLWSLGATLWAALEGRAPFDRGTAMATLTAVLTEELPKPQRAGALGPVLAGLLARDPAARLDHVRAEQQLRQVAEGFGDDPAPGAAAVAGPPAPAPALDAGGAGRRAGPATGGTRRAGGGSWPRIGGGGGDAGRHAAASAPAAPAAPPAATAPPDAGRQTVQALAAAGSFQHTAHGIAADLRRIRNGEPPSPRTLAVLGAAVAVVVVAVVLALVL